MLKGRPTGRIIAGLVAVWLGLSVAAGCTHGPNPDPVADDLAAALASGNLDDVQWAAGTPAVNDLVAARTTAFEGLADTVPTVVAADVDRTKNTAAVRLEWTWGLGVPVRKWSYSTSATLTLVDGEWVATWSPGLLAPHLTADETIVVTRTAPERGRVLGQGDAIIVEPRTVFRVGIDKTRVDPTGQDGAARALAAALGFDAAGTDAYAGRVASAGPKAFVQAIVVRDADPAYDLVALGSLPGVNLIEDRIPLAPTASFARAVLGTVGEATAEIIEESDGGVLEGELAGLSGLQRTYDKELRGVPGWDIVADSQSGVRRELFHTDPVTGSDLHTSLDIDLQTTAESLLLGQTSASAIVAIRPSTGEILAVASGAAGGGLSTATVGQYAPGSTFKIVSALALLRSGIAIDDPLPCPTTATIDGKEFANVPGYPATALGDIPFSTAFAHSCNTAFVSAADQVTDADLIAAARSLGLDPEVQAGIGGFLGSIPEDSSPTGHAAAMIGQGQVLASPLGMATVTASVVAGRTVIPWIVAPDSASTSSAKPTPTATPAASLTAEEAEALRAMMAGVVADGTATEVLGPLGQDVIAKTGTAEFVTGDGSAANHAWIVGARGDLAVAVFVDQGDLGATTAGPVLAGFLNLAG